MDKEAPGGNSSSRNVNLDNVVIQSLVRGAAAGVMHIISEDGSSFFILASQAAALSLSPGTELVRDVLAAADKEALAHMAYEKGMELLARREHGSKELEQKLLKRGFDSALIQETLIRLRTEGFLDDSRYAAEWLRVRVKRSPEGLSRLRMHLKRRGITDAVINAVFEQEGELLDEECLLQRAAEKLLRTQHPSRESFIRKLCSRGFAYSRVKALSEAYFGSN